MNKWTGQDGMLLIEHGTQPCGSIRKATCGYTWQGYQAWTWLGFGKLLGTGIHIDPLFYTTLDGHTDENLYQSSTSISYRLCIGIHRFIDMLWLAGGPTQAAVAASVQLIEVTKLDLFGGLVLLKAFSLNYWIPNIACCAGQTIQDVYLDVLLSVVFVSMLISTN